MATAKVVVKQVTPQVRTMTTGAEMLAMQNWVVVGDVLNTSKPAHRVANKLIESDKTVHLVNPRETEGRCFTTLKEIPPPIDVVDLIIGPKNGISIIDEMAELDIKNIFIQPGAGTTEIIEKCIANGINVHNGCVLMEL